MNAEIIVAVISGLVTVCTVIINSALTGREMNSKLDKSQAIMQTKLDELTREVREHNNFARRVPVIEKEIEAINRRLKRLEEKAS